MTSVELAQAALSCEPLARALELAVWIGAGRELTSTGVLRPALAAQACGVLGIELPPGKLRSAKDVEELQQAWEIAVAGEFVQTAGGRVRAARDVVVLLHAAQGPAPLPEALAERTLLAWIRGAGVPMGLPSAPCSLCVTVLHELSLATGAVEMGDLVEAVSQAGPGDLLARTGEYADLVTEDAVEHAHTSAGLLVFFGAAFTGPGRTPGGTLTLTPLGMMFAESVFASLAPPPAASVAAAVASVAGLPPKVSAAVLVQWSSARTTVVATRELLDFAEGAEPGLRFTALQLARDQGPAGTPAWRALAARPGFGSYARKWLSSVGEQVAEDDRDEAWLLADAMVEVSADAPPGVMPFVLATAVWQMAGDDALTVLDGLRESGHPAGPEIADAVGNFLSLTAGGPETFDIGDFGDLSALGDFADLGDLEEDDFPDLGYDLPKGALLQLKVALRGVSKPAVWRRVAVPAEMTLGDLHQVIVRAMGWDGGHMHSFSDGITEWGTADGGLDAEDEDEVNVGFVLSVPGERLSYLYDFGDSWEHDIKLEKVTMPGGPQASVPVCVAGKGACPPDDCGGSSGYAGLKAAMADPGHEDHKTLLEWLGVSDPAEFDPARFSLTEVNERLRRTGISAV